MGGWVGVDGGECNVFAFRDRLDRFWVLLVAVLDFSFNILRKGIPCVFTLVGHSAKPPFGC